MGRPGLLERQRLSPYFIGEDVGVQGGQHLSGGNVLAESHGHAFQEAFPVGKSHVHLAFRKKIAPAGDRILDGALGRGMGPVLHGVRSAQGRGQHLFLFGEQEAACDDQKDNDRRRSRSDDQLGGRFF